MKLKYCFETVEMGDEIICVPVGDAADQVHGVIKLNKSGLEIIELLKEETTEEEIVSKLSEKYENRKENLMQYVSNAVNTLRDAGMIEE